MTIKPKTKKDLQKNLKKTVEKLFRLLDFKIEGIEITTQDDRLSIDISVDPEESGILIGYHGETISALQLIFSMITYHQTQNWQPMSVNVNNYRQKRQQSLNEMAQNAVDRVIDSGQEIALPPLESYDRRIIHELLSDNEAVSTQSVGEGRNRRLVIYPKNV